MKCETGQIYREPKATPISLQAKLGARVKKQIYGVIMKEGIKVIILSDPEGVSPGSVPSGSEGTIINATTISGIQGYLVRAVDTEAGAERTYFYTDDQLVRKS